VSETSQKIFTKFGTGSSTLKFIDQLKQKTSHTSQIEFYQFPQKIVTQKTVLNIKYLIGLQKIYFKLYIF